MKEIGGETCYSAKGVAFMSGVGRNNLLRYLRSVKILDTKNIPTDKYWYKKWFRCCTEERNGIKTTTTYWTVKGVKSTLDIIDKATESGLIKKKKPKKEYQDPLFHLVEDRDRIFLDICLKNDIDVGKAFSSDRNKLRRHASYSEEKNEAIQFIKDNMHTVYETEIREIHYERETYNRSEVQEQISFEGTDIRDKSRDSRS